MHPHFGFRTLRAVTVATAGALLATACGGGISGPQDLAKEQTLHVNISVEPQTLDPGQTQWQYEAAVIRQTSEALLKPTPDLKDVQPAAAEKYDVSPDGLKYTFHLRKNAKYADGQPVKAQDFVYAWQRLIDPRIAAPYADFFAGAVKGGEAAEGLDPKKDADKIDPALNNMGLKAVDDYTFEVTLPQAEGYFKWIATLWNGSPMRKDVVKPLGDKWGAVAPASVQSLQASENGPYKITEIANKDHITVVANDNYWGGKPTITKIVLFEIEEANAAFAKYQNGELDITGVPPAQVDLVNSDPKLQKENDKEPSLSMFWLHFNNSKPPIDNPKVRQALAQGFDRSAYVKDVLKGVGFPSSTFIPKGMGGYAQDLSKTEDFNPTAAKQALDSSGVSKDMLNQIHYMASNTATGKQAAEFFKAQWKQNLGIDVTIDILDRKTVGRNQRAGNFQVSFGGWIADYPDQQDWFDIFRSKDGNNFEKYKNPKYDDLVAQADKTVDQKKRDDLYRQAHELLLNEYVAGFTYQGASWTLVKPYVKGFKATAIDDWTGDFFTTTMYIAKH